MNKINRGLIIAAPFVVAATTISTYVLLKKKKESGAQQEYQFPDTTTDSGGNTSTIDKDESSFINYQIFPVLHKDDFYKFIRIKNNEGIINDDFAKEAINYILRNMKVTDADISEGYEISDNEKELKITIQCKDKGLDKVFTKTYTFSISNVV